MSVPRLNSDSLDSITEQHRPMKVADAFWHETMFEYDWTRRIDLPVDHQRASNVRRTNYAYTASFKFNDDEAKAFIDYASAQNIPLLALAFTCYFVFLFKLSNGEVDFCVAMDTNSRYRPELKNIIGTVTG